MVDQEPARVEVGVGLEYRRDRLDYHFDNDSTYEGNTTVPHFFEQRYRIDGPSFVVAVNYGRRVRWTTRLSATGVISSIADDYDTFLLNGGSVAIEGTTGPASMRSLSIEQGAAVLISGSMWLSVAYRFRRDTADFGVGHKTISRNGALISAFDVSDAEYASSNMHSTILGLRVERGLGRDWVLEVNGEVSPLTVSVLTVELPVKYPGQQLSFTAKAFAGGGTASLSRSAGPWRVDLSAKASRTWSPDSGATITATLLGLNASISRGWR